MYETKAMFGEEEVARVAEDAIDLFLDYRDSWGEPEDVAKAKALIEVGSYLVTRAQTDPRVRSED